MKKIFKKLVSKDKVRLELSKVLLTKEKIVCTNSYTLLEVDRQCFAKDDALKLSILDQHFDKKTLLKPDELDMEEKILSVLPLEEDTLFPAYQQVIPTESDLANKYYTVKVNPQYLADVAQAIADTFKVKGYEYVTLAIPRSIDSEGKPVGMKPVIIKRDNGLAIGCVMPSNEK